MFMPRIAKIVHEGKKQEQLVPLMYKVGRLQCMLIGILVVGFAALGKSFVADIWNKPDLVQSYMCAVLLIIPSFFFLPLQIAKTTLIVENKVKLEAMAFLIMGLLNLGLSAVLSHYYGAIGAAVSIFSAYMVRNVLMIVIYHRVLQLNMLHFFKEVYLKLTPQLLITLAVGLLCSRFNPISNVYLRFASNGCVLVFTYFIMMWFCGFNAYEKGMFKALLRKFKK
jgi:O-antigen/teichoic acid export membrane protein